MTYDPISSPDPAVRKLALRHAELRREAARLDSILDAYASRPHHESHAFPVVPAIDHYPLLEGAECGCDTCGEWSVRRDEFVVAGRLIPKGHKWSTCSCGVCRFVGRIHLNYLAASNTRDLVIETSFHARHHSPFGPQVMQWLENELRDPKYTVNWRAQEMSRYPLDRWFRRCEAQLGPVVSGAVFRDGMHAIDAVTHFASSLNADGFVSG